MYVWFFFTKSFILFIRLRVDIIKILLLFSFFGKLLREEIFLQLVFFDLELVKAVTLLFVLMSLLLVISFVKLLLGLERFEIVVEHHVKVRKRVSGAFLFWVFVRFVTFCASVAFLLKWPVDLVMFFGLLFFIFA